MDSSALRDSSANQSIPSDSTNRPCRESWFQCHRSRVPALGVRVNNKLLERRK